LPEKPAEKPAAPASPAAAASKPAAKPAAAARPGSKLVVDEEDPFGIGAAGAGQAIQAALKPDKGRLQKVVCPMCETTGFVPKAALGKSVRCANVQCMVPVFTAADPTEPKSERRPTRMSDEAEAMRRAAEATAPRKRNPLIIYGVAGIVLLGLAFVVVSLLTFQKPPTQLSGPTDLSSFERLAAEEEAAAKAKAAAEEAAKVVTTDSPSTEVQALVKRMINLARQDLRDKPMARRMTGDLLLRIGKDAEAAAEFNQLIVVDKTRGFYRVLPYLGAYWRQLASGKAEAAAGSLRLAEAELLQRLVVNGPVTFKPVLKSGRATTEACLALACALVHEGRMEDATALVASRQMDRTIPANRDTIASTSWLFIASQFCETTLNPPPAMDSCLWTDPLHLAISVSLAGRGFWKEAVTWASQGTDARAVSDALVAITDVAMQSRPSAEVIALLNEAALAVTQPLMQLRVRAAVAAISGDASQLEACLQTLLQIPAVPAIAVPGTADLVRRTPSPVSDALLVALASAEVSRAAILKGKRSSAEQVLLRCYEAFAGAAPPTPEMRQMLDQISQQEDAVRQLIQTELRESNESKVNSMFRDYSTRVGQLSAAAEDRRAMLVLLLARLVYAGGAASVRESLNASPAVSAELQLDAMQHLLAVAAISTNQDFPEVMSMNADQAFVPGVGVFAPLVAALGRFSGPAWATSDDAWSTAYFSLESQTDLVPGLRLAMMCDLTRTLVSAGDPAAALAGIQQMKNGIWREEAMQIVGRGMARRKLDKKLLEWVANNKVPALEQICLMYGISLGVLERVNTTPGRVESKE